MQRQLAAVLFDMDGTLIDSEKMWSVALYELAEHYGGQLSAAARVAMVGTNSVESMRILHEDLGQPWRDADYGAAWVDARMAQLLGDGVEWQPGAAELLAEVRAAGLRTALVTNTVRRIAEVALRTLGEGNFDAVVCGDDVPAAKPDPAPYRRAVTLLGVPAQHCVAIEDSPAGVASARDAGCLTVAVEGTVALDGSADLTVPSLLALDVRILRALAR